MFSPQVQSVLDKVDRLRDQVDDHFQVAREEAMLLAQLVRIGRCVSICEVGTSDGLSTLHLAAAALENGGHVHRFEINPKKVAAATVSAAANGRPPSWSAASAPASRSCSDTP
jgi:predicted O-methyltransferase YrrM